MKLALEGAPFVGLPKTVTLITFVKLNYFPPMDTIYIYDIPIKKLKPYADLLIEYIGLPNPDLINALHNSDHTQTYELKELYPSKDIQALFDEFFPNVEGRDKHTSLLWLIANLYYGKSYENFKRWQEENSDPYWDCIEQEVLSLYTFIHDNPSEERVVVKLGKQSQKIDNTLGWFQAVLEKYVFPNVLPSVQNEDDARNLIRKIPVGRRIERPAVNAIVGGLSQYFHDEGLVKGKAPKQLLALLKKLLEMIKLIDVDDTYVDEVWIKSQINYCEKKGKEYYRLETPAPAVIVPKSYDEQEGFLVDPISRVIKQS